MKRIITILISGIGLLCSCSTDMDRALDELDRMMESRHHYRQEFLAKADSLKLLYDAAEEDTLKWKFANSLFQEYIHYSLDSSHVYLSLMKMHCVRDSDRVMTELAEVNILNQKHMDDLAVEKFQAIDTVLASSDELKKEYLSCAMYLYKNTDPVQMDKYRRAYLEIDTVSVFGRKIYAQHLRDNGEIDKALDILIACDGTEDNYHDKTSTVYNIAMLYDLKGDRHNKIMYLTRSGIYDVLAPNRDYMSIYQLALELHQMGDLKRAERYIETNLMDVISGGFSHRIINSSKAHRVITDTSEMRQRNQNLSVCVALVVLSLLLVALGCLLYYSRRQNRRLKEARRMLTAANDQAKKQNIKLKEANLIKDNYVFKYMNLSLTYIEKMEQMRHDIRHDLKEKPLADVVKALRNPSEIYSEYKNYYQIFDETFLNIFPDFREKVNELLREDCRLPISEDKTLVTELRILAVLRLGITESGKIATFLKCAPATIYTYRTKMRNAALCSKDEFEDKVRHL